MSRQTRPSPFRLLLRSLLVDLKETWSSDSDATESHGAEDRRIFLDLWRKTVETQMHFNEMSVKSRQLGLSFVVAALGVSVVLLGKPEDFQIPLPFIDYQTHPSGLLVLLSAFGVYAVMRLDLGVYHKMLRGAVSFGENLESELIQRGIIPIARGMTQSISAASREVDSKRTTAAAKIRRFYFFLIIVLVTLGISLLIATANPVPSRVSGNDGDTAEAISAEAGRE